MREIPFRAMEFFGIKSKNGATFSQKAEQAGKLQVLFNGSAMQAFNVKDSAQGTVVHRQNDG